MNTQEFVMNNRFLVNSAFNQVKDLKLDVQTRLEPRIMQLLILLVSNQEQVLTRADLIKDIWNDYGGADEGLTQAISFLRKILDDPSKQIIRTIPKKGYLLHASISTPDQPDKSAREKSPINKRRFQYFYPVIVIAGLIVIVAITYAFYSQQHQFPASKPPAGDTTTETPFPGLEEDNDNNPLTTITTTDSLGNRYRLVMIGDRKPKFYVNDSLQLNQEPYTGLIDKLAKSLWKRQKDAENRQLESR
jgi:DNA-binding winged helix-turn-helix (wHTH) protein